jgi:hypothetical protein
MAELGFPLRLTAEETAVLDFKSSSSPGDLSALYR